MKTRLLKISIVSSVIAVLTGVILFGFNIVSSAAPTVEPPGNAIKPTFNGVNVTGDITNPNTGSYDAWMGGSNDPVIINDYLSATTIVAGLDISNTGHATIISQNGISVMDNNTPLNLNDPVVINGNLSVTGNVITDLIIGINAADGKKNLTVNGNTTLGGTLNAKGDISNSFGSVNIIDDLLIAATLTVNGTSHVLGSSTVDSNLDVRGSISNNGAGGNAVTINDGLNVNGNIDNAAGGDVTFIDNVTIGSGPINGATSKNLTVNGDFVVKGYISNPVGGDVTVDDVFTVFDHFYAMGDSSMGDVQMGDLVIGPTDVKPDKSGAFIVGTDAKWIGIDGNEITSYLGKMFLNYDSGQDIDIGRAANPSNLKIYGKVTSTGGFGTYSPTTATDPLGVNAGNRSFSASCPGTQILINCGAYAAPAANNFSLKGLRTQGQTCTADWNVVTNGTQLSVVIICLDPSV